MRWLALVVGSLVLGTACDGARRPTALQTATPDAVQPSTATVVSREPLPATQSGDTRVPVVVELFSSEGCSSCPPADEALRDLDEKQPIDGVVVIPLEMHVDYWNDLGWADPWSSRLYSARQEEYAAGSRRSGVFTPEAIIDGGASIVGSNRPGLADLIHDAATHKHVAVNVASVGDKVRVSLGDDVPHGAMLWVAMTEPNLESHVLAGENRGRTLRHSPVVRGLTRVGEATPGVVEIDPGFPRDGAGARIVAFVESRPDGAIVGAASTAR